MSFGMFVTWVLVGALVGVLAGLVMKGGGYGLQKDLMLAITGSIVACWIFRAVGVFPGAGMVAMALVAAVGACAAVVAQRKLMATELPADDKRATWRWGFGAVRTDTTRPGPALPSAGVPTTRPAEPTWACC